MPILAIPSRARSRLPKSTRTAPNVAASRPAIPPLGPTTPSIRARRYRLVGSRPLSKRPNSDPGAAPPHRVLVDEDQAPPVREGGAGRLGDEELMRRALGHPLEPRGRVGGVADRGVLDPPLGADLPGHDAAAVDADADLEAFAEPPGADPLVESGQAHGEHLLGGGDRTAGVVGLLDRRSEDGHDAVAHVGD